MKILGFNPSHHGSVCLLEDGEINFFIEEERLTRRKHDGGTVSSFIHILQNYNVDIITWGTPSLSYPLFMGSSLSYWEIIASKFNKTFKKAIDFSPSQHHTCHASHAFYNSGFKESLCLIIDGVGSAFLDDNNKYMGQETETIFKCSYPNNFKVLYKNFKFPESSMNLSQVYEAVTMHLGWEVNEAGKTMGLAPYGKSNKNFPNFFLENKGNSKIFYTDHDQDPIIGYPHKFFHFIDDKNNSQFKLKVHPKEWHYDESKITSLEKDLAWKVQNDTQQLVGDYIEKAIQETGLKQVCCAGGYFLNCVTNYYLLKRFPGIEFYFEPIANDSGTAIGASKLVWHKETQDTTIRPLKSLYLGKQYSKEELLEGIKKYVDTSQ